MQDLVEQRKKGYNPGVALRIKDPETNEFANIHINIEKLAELAKGRYSFEGILSHPLYICEWYYPDTTAVSGHLTDDGCLVCTIIISIEGRRARADGPVITKKDRAKRYAYERMLSNLLKAPRQASSL